MLKLLTGRMLGIVLTIVSSKLSAKWQWLAHFLLASGNPLTLPESLAEEWDSNLVRAVDNGKYLIRPYPSELFWIVGSMIVTIQDNKVYGEDIYNFAPQTGQRVVHGSDKSLQYAWSGGDNDPTQIKGSLAKIGLFFFRLIGIGDDIVKIDCEDRLLISNNLWNVLGGKPFKTILDYNTNRGIYFSGR